MKLKNGFPFKSLIMTIYQTIMLSVLCLLSKEGVLQQMSYLVSIGYVSGCNPVPDWLICTVELVRLTGIG